MNHLEREPSPTHAGFQLTDEMQWDEQPRNRLSRSIRWLGWLGAVAWIISFVVFLIWRTGTESDSLQFEAIVSAGLVVVLLLFVVAALFERT